MVTYNRQLNLHHDQKVAMFSTMRAQGRPVIYVSLALAAGFMALVFSNFVPTVHFGLLAAGVMVLAMFGELMLTPILMYSTRLVTLWDLIQTRMDPAVVRTAPLRQGLTRWEARKVVRLGRLDSVAVGEHVLRKGERGTEMYMVVSGRGRVSEPGAAQCLGHRRDAGRGAPARPGGLRAHPPALPVHRRQALPQPRPRAGPAPASHHDAVARRAAAGRRPRPRRPGLT
jgi:hypothetical protein